MMIEDEMRTPEEKRLEEQRIKEQKEKQAFLESELAKKDLANPGEMNYQVLIKFQQLNKILLDIGKAIREGTNQLHSTNLQIFNLAKIIAKGKGMNIEEEKKEEVQEEPKLDKEEFGL